MSSSPPEVPIHDPDCQFCQIATAYPPPPSDAPHPSWIANTPPSPTLPFQNHTILATPTVLAFLDYYRISPGHLLLIPRAHHATLASLPPATAAELGRWLPVLSCLVCDVAGVKDWNVQQNNGARAGQTVGHVHFHVVPRPERVRRKKDRDVRWARARGFEPREEFEEEEGEEMARGLREGLGREVERMRGNGGAGAGGGGGERL
ncbi:HIT-like protein [Viridothelium virens]|uniref:HIT-like protein n=1 Tax=Viridothelium virens TaxID=1048519 RepID=A0A6A6H9X7_VIRVR|nr:HIT-like protein [Viridothelium virens]